MHALSFHSGTYIDEDKANKDLLNYRKIFNFEVDILERRSNKKTHSEPRR